VDCSVTRVQRSDLNEIISEGNDGKGSEIDIRSSQLPLKILPNPGISYFLNCTGFSHIGKWPISSMMMHSEFFTRLAVLSVFSGVQAQS